jgi:TonB family protein
MHVTDLVSLPDFLDSKDNTKITPKPIRLRPEVDELPLTQKQVKYPISAGLEHLQGGVRIVAIITTEGTIADLDVIASPKKVLTKAATDAVRTWTYRPYLQNGIPAEFETTIDVNFALKR